MEDNEVIQSDSISNLYRKELHEQWVEAKTMEHASGIWGREMMFGYLKEIIAKGETVVDLGCGAGYPTIKVAEMVGESGKVIGIERSKSMLGLEDGQTPLAEKYKQLNNVTFINADITATALGDESVDVVVSFMVLHNLSMDKVKGTLKETFRILKRGGKAVFLTMHSEALDKPWDLDFMNYDKDAIETYRQAEYKEGITVKGIVRSAGGGEKEVMMITHTRENMLQAIAEAKLKLVDEKDLWIDEVTAKEKFGNDSVRKLPSTPIFWMITVQKDLD